MPIVQAYGIHLVILLLDGYTTLYKINHFIAYIHFLNMKEV